MVSEQCQVSIYSMFNYRRLCISCDCNAGVEHYATTDQGSLITTDIAASAPQIQLRLTIVRVYKLYLLTETMTCLCIKVLTYLQSFGG